VTLIFSEKAWDDYLYWQSTDQKLVKRINELIKVCIRSAYNGIGKPEPLRGQLSGWWSRRITQEHRLVYRMLEDGLLIAQCRYHY
jgi:toxin YoeB